MASSSASLKSYLCVCVRVCVCAEYVIGRSTRAGMYLLQLEAICAATRNEERAAGCAAVMLLIVMPDAGTKDWLYIRLMRYAHDEPHNTTQTYSSRRPDLDSAKVIV